MGAASTAQEERGARGAPSLAEPPVHARPRQALWAGPGCLNENGFPRVHQTPDGRTGWTLCPNDVDPKLQGTATLSAAVPPKTPAVASRGLQPRRPHPTRQRTPTGSEVSAPSARERQRRTVPALHPQFPSQPHSPEHFRGCTSTLSD